MLSHLTLRDMTATAASGPSTSDRDRSTATADTDTKRCPSASLDAHHWRDEAGRAAYLAGLHAAQALIFESTD